MATESPTKRLRRTCPEPEPEPEPDFESDNDQDGDELVFEPEEISNRRDPDVKLMRKRIKAHSRFELAFTNIFSKYGKNFCEVGDELDWRTGELVLNNGHLQNMRHDLDVGIEEEEEGTLLEDLEEDEEDEGVRLEDLRDDDEDMSSEEGHIMRGHAASPSMKLTKLDPLGGRPPTLHAKSWEDVRVIDWSGLSVQKPRRTVEDGATAGADYSGAKSIWAPEPGYEDHWTPIPSSRVGTIGSLRQTISSSKMLPTPPDASLVATGHFKSKSLGSEELPNPRKLLDDGDDLIAACPTTKQYDLHRGSSSTSGKVMTMRALRGLPREPEEKSKPKPKPMPTKQKKSIKKSSPRSTPFNQLAVSRKQLTPTPLPSDLNCRRSTRVRYQTDYLGMNSLAKSVKKTATNIVVELPLRTVRKEDYMLVPDILLTPSESGEEMEDVEASSHKRIIPDSQETGESRESSPVREEEVRRDVDKNQEENLGSEDAPEEAHSAFSDVEAPNKKPTFNDPSNTTATKAISESLSGGSIPLGLSVHGKRQRRTRESTQTVLSDECATVVSADAEGSVQLEELYREPASNIRGQVAISSQRCDDNGCFAGGVPKSDPRRISRDNSGSEAEQEPRAGSPMSLQHTIQTDTATEALETPAQEARPRNKPRSRISLQQMGRQQQPSPDSDLVTYVAAGPSKQALSKRRGRPRKSLRSGADKGVSQKVPDSQEELVESEEQTLATANPEHGQSEEMAKGAPPCSEAPEPMDVDTTLPKPPAFPKPPIQPLSSNHTIADSASEPGSSALQVKLQNPPSRKHKTTPSKPTPSKATSSRLSPSKASPKPSTPRHSALRTSKTPTSRRSILSLLSDDDDTDTSSDELLRSDDLIRLFDSPSTERLAKKLGSARKTPGNNTPLTTKIYRTPLKKKRRRSENSPGDIAEISAGPTRTCGVDDYKCQGDFCFNCL